MAEHEKAKTGKFVSQTQYILRLIEADKQKNIELYEKLEQIEKMKRELATQKVNSYKIITFSTTDVLASEGSNL